MIEIEFEQKFVYELTVDFDTLINSKDGGCRRQLFEPYGGIRGDSIPLSESIRWKG